MLVLGMMASLLWSSHFFLLGALTGAAMNLLSTVRSYVYYKVKPTKKNRWVLWLFEALTVIATALTWAGLISLLPLVGSLFSVIAFWHKKPKIIRRLAIGSSPPWFVYNTIIGSYPGMAVEVLLVTSNLVGQYRFDFRPVIHRRVSHLTKMPHIAKIP